MVATIFNANCYLDMLQLDFRCFSRYGVILTNGYRIDIIFFFFQNLSYQQNKFFTR